MPPLSLPNLSTLPGKVEGAMHGVLLHGLTPPLVAFGVTLALGAIGWAGVRWLLPVAGTLGALAGWMALMPGLTALRAILTPRALSDYLLLPAAAAVLAGLAAPWLRGRAERWAQVALVALAGWWLAGSAPARPEFWRVWLAVALAAWLLARGVAGRGAAGAGGRALAAALALWGGLLLAGAPPVWIAAALAAAAAAVAAWCFGTALPPVLLVTAAAAADLGAGRLVRGRLNAADLACLLALAAAWLVPWAGVRFGQRLGRAGPAAAVLATTALCMGAVGLGARLLQR